MTATASRKAASLPMDNDDFWGQAPAAAWQPSQDDVRQQPVAPGEPQTVHRAERRIPVPANDAPSGPGSALRTPDAIAPWGLPRSREAQRTRSIARNRIAIAAAAGVVALLGIGAAALTFSGGQADGENEMVASTTAMSTPAEPAPSPAVAAMPEAPAEPEPTKAADADIYDGKMQALMEAAEIKPVTEAVAAEPAAVRSEPDSADAGSQPFPVAEAEQAPLAAGPEADEAVGEAPAQPDEMATAALRPVESAPPLAAAGEDASEEMAALAPAETESQVEAGTEETDAATAPSEIELLAATATKTTVKKWVNMRTGPADDAASITVIPADAEVSVISCDGWCQVIYKGEQGWVYKSFVRDAEKLAAKDG